LFFGTLICSGISCSKGPGFLRSYGEDVTIVRALPAFRQFSVGEKFKIYLTQDTNLPEQITISYGSNLVDKIETKVNNSILEIKDANGYNWVRNLDVQPVCTLNVHHLDAIQLHGAAELECKDTIFSNNLRVDANGVGKHHLLVYCGTISGSCSNAGIVIFRGHGGVFAWSCENGAWIDASEMNSYDVYIYHYTERDIWVNPSSIFKVNVYNKGNVYYYRDPVLAFEKLELGSGKVIKK
jgi:hypothetical protein